MSLGWASIAWQIYLKAKNNVQQQIILLHSPFISCPPTPLFKISIQRDRGSLTVKLFRNQCGVLETSWMTYFWISAKIRELANRGCKAPLSFTIVLLLFLPENGEQGARILFIPVQLNQHAINNFVGKVHLICESYIIYSWTRTNPEYSSIKCSLIYILKYGVYCQIKFFLKKTRCCIVFFLILQNLFFRDVEILNNSST